jgi:hypothetical protein
MRELLRISSLKEGAAGAVGEYHFENQAVGEKAETDHRRHKHSPCKRRNDSAPVDHSGQIALKREQCGV